MAVMDTVDMEDILLNPFRQMVRPPPELKEQWCAALGKTTRLSADAVERPDRTLSPVEAEREAMRHLKLHAMIHQILLRIPPPQDQLRN